MAKPGKSKTVGKPFKVKVSGKALTLGQTATKYGVSAGQARDVAKGIAVSDPQFAGSHVQQLLSKISKQWQATGAFTTKKYGPAAHFKVRSKIAKATKANSAQARKASRRAK